MPFVVETDTYALEGVGLPDYSAAAPIGQVGKPTTYTLSDMAELAARLGSIDTFDRRGDWVWGDNFEDNINKWELSAPGTGASIALSGEAARNGVSSAKLIVGEEDGSISRLRKFLPLPVDSKIGFEISFSSDTRLESIEIRVVFWTGTTTNEARFRYTPGAGSRPLELWSGGWVTFATVATQLRESTLLFHTVKLVIDTSTGQYIRLILDDLEYDISAYSYDSTSLVFAAYLEWWIQVEGDSGLGVNAVCHLDDAIITQNEPQNV